MAKKHPIVHVYRSQDDLVQLKEWFYNFESKDNRFLAVQKVKALSSRGKLPHVIEITSLLTSIVLQDNNGQLDTNLLQLSYSMALIRFVNGLLDPFQQSNFAIPLHQLAKKLNLPSFFVELRHISTHESLPNLPICRIAAKRALNWLYDNYWNSLLDDDELEDSDDSEEQDDNISESDKNYIINEANSINAIISSSKLLENLKLYKKIRKSNLDLVYKFGETSSLAKSYWKCVKSIKSIQQQDIIMNTLIFGNFLIYNVDKIDTSKKNRFNSLLLKLYKPLLDEMGLAFKLQLFRKIIGTLESYYQPQASIESLINSKLNWQVTHPFEVSQLLEWLKFLINDILYYEDYEGLGTRNEILSQQLDDLAKFHKVVPQENDVQTNFQKILLLLQETFETKTMKNVIKQETKSQVATWIDSVNNIIDVRTSYEPPPSLDELLGEHSPSAKSDEPKPMVKRQKKEQKTYFFEEIPNWEPTAFGTWV